jgi:hypothetical protein
MEMFLMGLCVSVFGLGVAAAAFGAATRSESSNSAVQPQQPVVKPAVPTRFFSDRAVATSVPSQQVPIEVLLQQIENHVRLEQAAAESFVAFPTEALLHSKTTSSFVN